MLPKIYSYRFIGSLFSVANSRTSLISQRPQPAHSGVCPVVGKNPYREIHNLKDKFLTQLDKLGAYVNFQSKSGAYPTPTFVRVRRYVRTAMWI